MKKIFLILVGVLFLVFVSCNIYENETYDVSNADINVNNSLKNDSTLTIDSLELVVLESISKKFDETWVDTTNDWLDVNYKVIGIDTTIGSIDTLSDTTSTGADTTIYDTSYVLYTDILDSNLVLLDTIGTVNITPKNLNNGKYFLQSSIKKSGYAVLDMSGQSADVQLDIYLSDFFALTVWKTDGTLLGFDDNSIPLETYNYDGNIIKEHYAYKMQNEKYIVRFNPAESATSKDFQILVLQNYERED